MLRKSLLPGISVLAFIAGSVVINATAASNTNLLFSNTKGLIDAGSCTPGSKADIGFRISLNSEQNFENLRNSRRRVISKLVNYSLVKTRKDTAMSEYEAIEVTGISENPNIKIASGKKAQRNDIGYLYKNSLKSLKEYVIEITEDITLENSSKVSVIPGVNKNIKGAFLQAAMSGENFVTATCEGKEYAAFDVHVKDIEGAAARILVSLDDTKIFKNIRTYTQDAAEEAISEGSEAKADVSTESEGSGSVTLSAADQDKELDESLADETVEVNAGTVVTTAPIVVENFFEYVVCLSNKDSTLNVWSDEARKGSIKFTLKNGTSVKTSQDLSGSATAASIKIQDVVSGQTGWVASQYVKQAASCLSAESDAPAAGNTTTAASGDKMATGEYKVCTESGGSLTVYDLNWNRLASKFSLDSGEKAQVVNGTLVDKQPEANGYKYVQVKTESNYDRFVAKDFLTQGKCATAPSEEASTGDSGRSVDGYIFPTYQKSGFSYLAAGSRPETFSYFCPASLGKSICPAGKGMSGYNNNYGLYGARRSGGKRGHAATDIYQRWGQSKPSSDYRTSHFGGGVRSMTGGKVIRGSTFFYLDTYYIVIKHDDNVVSRYGEIYAGTKVSDNQRVETGTKLGYVKWVGVSGVAPMLHLENYNYHKDIAGGALGGSKKVNGRNTQRHSSLFNRTDFIKKLELNTF